MMKVFLPALLGLFLICSPASAAAEDPDSQAALKTLVGKVNDKIQSGDQAERDYAAELAEFDAILARYGGEKSNAAAEVLLMKATLYLQVFSDDAKGVPILNELLSKYPKTKAADAAAEIMDSIGKQQAGAKIQASLQVGMPFPAFDEKDLEGNPFSLAAVKGKVVLIDFWATWCMPCLMELPSVHAAYDKYHAKGFEVLGISLDEDKSSLEAFLKKRKMTWPQYFDGRHWQNKLAVKYGVRQIPATYLLDQKGIIIGKDLAGGELDDTVARALRKK